jgi:RsiW-degrading membrane proteinase PrsW (M82 family)
MFELLGIAIAPAIFILWYLYRKDSYGPEPLHLVLWVFILGALSTIPTVILELPFGSDPFTAVIIAPIVEECLKFSVVFFIMYRHTEFDEPMDGIIYAAAAGLGFASIENILYVLGGGASVGIIRAITSVPGHVIFSCIWGFALGTAKFRPASQRRGIILMGLVGAILLHAIYNFSAEFFQALGLLLILVVFIPFGWWITCRNILFAHADPASACSALNRTGSHDTSLSVPVPSAIGTDLVKVEDDLVVPEQQVDENNFNAL